MKRKIIKYLEKNLKQLIINEVCDVAYYHANPRRKKKEAGFFSIPREVFCCVDYLGHLAYGKGSTESAEAFIKEYFPWNYHDYAELIYSMWRHGTVHEYKPKTFYAEYPNQAPKKIKVYWLSNNDNKKATRKGHLKFFSMIGKRATLYLCVNICQLVDDLLVALDKFVDRLKSNRKLERECQKRLNDVIKSKDYKTIKRKQSRQAVYSEIFLAWNNREKQKIDRFGNTIQTK